MGVHPPPFRRIGNFRFFPRLFSFFFRNFKMIIYAPWNRYCMIQRTRLWSTGLSTLKEEEKKAYIWTFGSVNNTIKYIVHQSSKIWSYLQKYNTNNGILCVKHVEYFLSGGGQKCQIMRWNCSKGYWHSHEQSCQENNQSESHAVVKKYEW